MNKSYSSIWGIPHLLDHSTGLQSPLGSSSIARVTSILLDKVKKELQANQPGLHTDWLGTFSLPIVQPTSKPLTLSLDLRFFVVQAQGGYVRIRLTTPGIKETLDFRDAEPTALGQDGLMHIPRIDLPANATSFNCRFDLVVDRPNTEQITIVSLDTIDIKAC